MVPFIQQWRVGLGIKGEQGVESIHARFNALERMYNNMNNRVERLNCIMEEHLQKICLANILRQPSAKKRKISTEPEE